MNVFLNVIVALQIIAALAMIGLVLIQHGKGADMGASFGSGASGSLFGATGSANFLSRSTAVCAAIFFVCTLALAYFSNDRSRPASSSILERPAITVPAASAPLGGAALIPGATGAVASSVASGVAASPPAASASGAGAIPAK